MLAQLGIDRERLLVAGAARDLGFIEAAGRFEGLWR